jgi:hypothetical protein
MCLFPMSPDRVSDYPSQLFYDLRKLSAKKPAEGLRDFVKDHWTMRFVRPAPLDYGVQHGIFHDPTEEKPRWLETKPRFESELRGNASSRKGRAKLFSPCLSSLLFIWDVLLLGCIPQ